MRHCKQPERSHTAFECDIHIPYLMLFRTRRYFRTKSTVFAPVQLRCFLSEVELLCKKRKRTIAAFRRCFYLRLLISNANSTGVRVWWRRIYAHMQQNPKKSPVRSSANTHPSRICVTDQKSEVKTAMKSPDNPLSFPEKQYEFGEKTREVYWGE